MLDECRKKVDSHGLADRCGLLQGDVFEHQCPAAIYDCALVGFLLSHLTESQEALLFATLKRMLVPSGHFLLLEFSVESRAGEGQHQGRSAGAG